MFAHKFSLLTLTLIFSLSLSNPDEDLVALLAFKASSSNPSNSLSSWLNNSSSHPCSASSWLGVTCDNITHRVTGLVLDGLNLSGSTQPLTRLAHLRHLSLNYNLLSSSSTLNLSSWPHLKHLYLSHNRFTGIFPIGISNLRGLRLLELSHNSFSGEIPLTELIRLPHLLTLRLESNSFTGTLNSVNSPSPSSSILDFNVSDNDLAGEIPSWVSHFPASSFAGNKDLCGQPLPYDCSNRTVESESTKPINKRMVPVYIGGDVAAVLGVIVTVTCLVFKRRRGGSGTQWDTWHRGTHCNGYDDVCKCNGEVEVEKENEKEMVVFEGCKGFDKVGDLLKSSAELLGQGCVGTTFKLLMDGGDDVVVVVKRVVREKLMKLKNKEVDEWLRVIGGVKHSNIVSLRAYHHSSNELLLVYDFLPHGSLHSLLHENRGPGRTPLDWSTRLKLASGSAQGLAFLHCYNKAKLFHGHLTSSNILVDHLGNACLVDIGLHQLFSTTSSSHNANKAPELMLNNNNISQSQRNFTQKSDVYSFGVILLEILTGRMAMEEGDMSLVKWVQSVAPAREEWTWEVIDFELLVHKEMELEMMALLQVALLCVAPLPKDRPKMSMVHRMIEDIRMRSGKKDRTSSILSHLSSTSSLSPSELC